MYFSFCEWGGSPDGKNAFGLSGDSHSLSARVPLRLALKMCPGMARRCYKQGICPPRTCEPRVPIFTPAALRGSRDMLHCLGSFRDSSCLRGGLGPALPRRREDAKKQKVLWRSLMPRDTLTVIDNRTGKSYEIPITDSSIRAKDLRPIKTSGDEYG